RWRPKGGRMREVPMPLGMAEVARLHAERYASAHWMVPSPYSEGGVLPMSADTVGKHLRAIVTDAGMTYGQAHPSGVTFHTLRHTFASWLVMDGTDLLTVARLLGHTKIKMVEETYGHLAPEHRRRAVERLAGRIVGAFAADASEAATFAPGEVGRV
ncbi:MAG TPA: tyrosine-type recombinase/integrase, partial [Gemmatimonadaceae bacterium]|nr:tyrosine-type recombinase/integrase [Gemmatimonadaceae bacterium]